MKPEQLKQIAEYMGYETKMNCAIGGSDFLPVVIREEDGLCGYNPLTNAEQSQELQVKCGIDIATYPAGDWWAATVWDTDINIGVGIPEELEQLSAYRELILNAAWEVVKENSGE